MNRKQLNNLSFIFSTFGVVSLVFLAIGIKNIENYTNWLLFSLVSIACGIAIAWIIYFFLCLFEPKVKTYKNSKGFRLWHYLVFGFVLTSFGTLRLINEYQVRETNCKLYKIDRLGKSSSKNPQHFIFIDGTGGKERLSFGKSFNKSLQDKDSIALCLHKGLLGFRFYQPK